MERKLQLLLILRALSMLIQASTAVRTFHPFTEENIFDSYIFKMTFLNAISFNSYWFELLLMRKYIYVKTVYQLCWLVASGVCHQEQENNSFSSTCIALCFLSTQHFKKLFYLTFKNNLGNLKCLIYMADTQLIRTMIN